MRQDRNQVRRAKSKPELNLAKERSFVSMLVCLDRSTSRMWREVIHGLCSTSVRPDLECCVQLWGSQHEKDIDLFKWVHSRAMEMIRGDPSSTSSESSALTDAFLP